MKKPFTIDYVYQEIIQKIYLSNFLDDGQKMDADIRNWIKMLRDTGSGREATFNSRDCPYACFYASRDTRDYERSYCGSNEWTG